MKNKDMAQRRISRMSGLVSNLRVSLNMLELERAREEVQFLEEYLLDLAGIIDNESQE